MDWDGTAVETGAGLCRVFPHVARRDSGNVGQNSFAKEKSWQNPEGIGFFHGQDAEKIDGLLVLDLAGSTHGKAQIKRACKRLVLLGAQKLQKLVFQKAWLLGYGF